jgi:hypothetical protein
MAGIIFFKTNNLKTISDFYQNRLGFTLWKDQGSCQILQHGNLMLGFCSSYEKTLENRGTITLFYNSKEEVDKEYTKLQDISTTTPKDNPKFSIYHFWGKDPEDRSLEFQVFLD